MPTTEVLDELVSDAFASRLFAGDPTLWGPDAEAEASIRLGWTRLHESSRGLVPEIEELRAQFRSRGLDRVLLCGMGGSSLAPEVICAGEGDSAASLVVLDSSHPDMVRSALTELERTVVVVSSKSGGTLETDSQRRAAEAAFEQAGIDPADRIVVVTDPGSPLDEEALASGYRVFRADPHVGGRYSALTAFGLVPSGLAGADIAALLDGAAEIAPRLAADAADNPGLTLGVDLGVAAREGRDTLVFIADEQHHPGFGDWVEQLVAESTGKSGTGILPMIVPSAQSPHTTDDTVIAPVHNLPLGAAFLLWEMATAVVGRVLGINPFDQPDVESAKAAAREMLESNAVRSPGERPSADRIDEFLGTVDEHGYVAVQVYLDRWAHADFARVRDSLQARLGRPVTFGWGPRFLHSTGQFHKGGRPVGSFIQVTDSPAADLPIPGREFTFGEFIASQAAGDARVLEGLGRPVLRLHLDDPATQLAGLGELLA